MEKDYLLYKKKISSLYKIYDKELKKCKKKIFYNINKNNTYTIFNVLISINNNSKYNVDECCFHIIEKLTSEYYITKCMYKKPNQIIIFHKLINYDSERLKKRKEISNILNNMHSQSFKLLL